MDMEGTLQRAGARQLQSACCRDGQGTRVRTVECITVGHRALGSDARLSPGRGCQKVIGPSLTPGKFFSFQSTLSAVKHFRNVN